MAASAEAQVLFNGGTSGGTANAQTLAGTNPSGFSLATTAPYGVISFVAGVSNTGSATLNIASTGAKTIKKQSTSGLVNLASGDITSGQQYSVWYDGTYYELDTRFFNVINYGADPTGVADSTVALNQAVSAACLPNTASTTNSPGSVYVPAGNFKLTGTVKMTCSGVSLICDSANSTIFNQTTGGIDTILIRSTGYQTDTLPMSGASVLECGFTNSGGTSQSAGAVIHVWWVNNASYSVNISGNYYQGVVLEGAGPGIVLQNSIISENRVTSCTAPPCRMDLSAGVVIKRVQVSMLTPGAIQDLQHMANYYIFPTDIAESNVQITLPEGAAAFGEDFRTLDGLQLSNVQVQGGDVANFHFYVEQENGSISSMQWQNVRGLGNGGLTSPVTEYGMFFEWDALLNNISGGSGVKGSFGNVILNNYSQNALFLNQGWDNAGSTYMGTAGQVEPFLVTFDGCSLVDAQRDGVLIQGGSADWTFNNCTLYGNGFAARAGTTAYVWYGTITTTIGSNSFTLNPVMTTGYRLPAVGDDLYAKSVPSSGSSTLYTTITAVSCSGSTCTGTMSNPAYFSATGATVSYGAFYTDYNIQSGQRMSINGGTLNCGGTVAFGIATYGTKLLGFAAHDLAFSNFSGALTGCLQPMLLAHTNSTYDNIKGSFNYPVISGNGSGSYQIPSSSIIYVDPTYDAAYVSGSTTIQTIEATPTEYSGEASWDARRIVLTFEQALTIGVSGNISTSTGSGVSVNAGQSCEFSYIAPTWHLIVCGG